MGAACTFIAGCIVFVMGTAAAIDDWVDAPVRWTGGAFAVVIGVGTILHALGVW